MSSVLRLAQRLQARADRLERTRILSPIEVVEFVADLRDAVQVIRSEHETTRDSAKWQRLIESPTR